jgi:colicin import membrane protein
MTETLARVEAASTEVAEYNPVTAGLAELASRLRGRAYDLTTTKGDREARADRMECVKLRTTLEATRKRIKEPALRYSQLIDAEAKRINSAIAALELPIDQQIRADEDRREQERERKAAENAARIAAIQCRIDDITNVAIRAIGKPAAEIEAKIQLLCRITIGEAFQELQPKAAAAHLETLGKLREMHAATIEADRIAAEREAAAEAERIERERIASEQRAEAARLSAERAELERQQAEAFAEQARIDAAARAEREAADRKAAEERAEADRIARERLEVERAEISARRAEVERQEAEAADRRRQELGVELIDSPDTGYPSRVIDGEHVPCAHNGSVPNNDEVICPNCAHQFRAIPVNVQNRERVMLAALQGVAASVERFDVDGIACRSDQMLAVYAAIEKVTGAVADGATG